MKSNLNSYALRDVSSSHTIRTSYESQVILTIIPGWHFPTKIQSRQARLFTRSSGLTKPSIQKRWWGGSNSYDFIGIDPLKRTPPCANVASFRTQNPERFFDHHAPPGERADRHNQRRRHGHAEQID